MKIPSVIFGWDPVVAAAAVAAQQTLIVFMQGSFPTDTPVIDCGGVIEFHGANVAFGGVPELTIPSGVTLLNPKRFVDCIVDCVSSSAQPSIVITGNTSLSFLNASLVQDASASYPPIVIGTLAASGAVTVHMIGGGQHKSALNEMFKMSNSSVLTLAMAACSKPLSLGANGLMSDDGTCIANVLFDTTCGNNVLTHPGFTGTATYSRSDDDQVLLVASGATGSRPTALQIGQRYFDTTLGIPIWWNGTNWINASGATV